MTAMHPYDIHRPVTGIVSIAPVSRGIVTPNEARDLFLGGSFFGTLPTEHSSHDEWVWDCDDCFAEVMHLAFTPCAKPPRPKRPRDDVIEVWGSNDPIRT